jgi:hypothetical protein
MGRSCFMTVIVSGISLKSFLPCELVVDADTKILCVLLPLWCQYCPISLQLDHFCILFLFSTTLVLNFSIILYVLLLDIIYACYFLQNFWHFSVMHRLQKHCKLTLCSPDYISYTRACAHMRTQSSSCVWLIKCDWAPVSCSSAYEISQSRKLHLNKVSLCFLAIRCN